VAFVLAWLDHAAESPAWKEGAAGEAAAILVVVKGKEEARTNEPLFVWRMMNKL
jgi:hypothetical protein